MPSGQSPRERLAAVHEPWIGYFGMLLSKDEVQQRLGGVSGVEMDHLVDTHQILALPVKPGELAYPEFQFAKAGLVPVVATILAILEPVVESPYMIAAWFITPQPVLNGDTPSQWLKKTRNPKRLEEAARDSAARLGQ
jgi:hypothetical protein